MLGFVYCRCKSWKPEVGGKSVLAVAQPLFECLDGSITEAIVRCAAVLFFEPAESVEQIQRPALRIFVDDLAGVAAIDADLGTAALYLLLL